MFSEFRGKSIPVHFFWGAFDLAVTRFSGDVPTYAAVRGAEDPDALLRAFLERTHRAAAEIAHWE